MSNILLIKASVFALKAAADAPHYAARGAVAAGLAAALALDEDVQAACWVAAGIRAQGRHDPLRPADGTGFHRQVEAAAMAAAGYHPRSGDPMTPQEARKQCLAVCGAADVVGLMGIAHLWEAEQTQQIGFMKAVLGDLSRDYAAVMDGRVRFLMECVIRRDSPVTRA